MASLWKSLILVVQNLFKRSKQLHFWYLLVLCLFYTCLTDSIKHLKPSVLFVDFLRNTLHISSTLASSFAHAVRILLAELLAPRAGRGQTRTSVQDKTGDAAICKNECTKANNTMIAARQRANYNPANFSSESQHPIRNSHGRYTAAK